MHDREIKRDEKERERGRKGETLLPIFFFSFLPKTSSSFWAVIQQKLISGRECESGEGERERERGRGKKKKRVETLETPAQSCIK